ncbi:RHS repeat-associated core domain-containing protein [Burkholderia sp. BCC1985]|uniref:RHS repeat-associated core domain-containing protein n=1 Tax=Burkholderia sp. BCC1985 TaxID=2817442 RepID=UPI002AAF3BCD|nr:RHS repeat-associated core domain-containing protein [Burkholderia sp. BCC1985]
MALPAVKHLDPVVGVDVHSVLVTPGTPPVFLPHPHVGFMLDLREYVQAAKAVVGCIAMIIVQEKVTEYIEDHPEDVEKLAHLADEANRQINDLMGGGKLPDFKDDPNVAEGMRLAKEANQIKNRISDDLGSNVGSGGSSGRPIFVNGMMRATAGTHAYHVPGLHFPLGESFAPPPEEVEPSNDGESFMGSKTVLANNDPMSYMALEALSCWSVGMEPPPHNSAHTDRTYPSMPSSAMLPIPAGRPVFVGGPPIMNMAAAAKGLFKAFQGSKWAKALADRLHLKSGFLRCKVLKAEPVDVTTGEVVVQQSDFTVSGRLPIVWDRYYASHDSYAGAVGVGWQTPADIRIELMRNEDGIGAVAHFPDHTTAFNVVPADDGWPARTYDWQHGHAVYADDGRMVLRTREGIEYGFVLPSRWRDAAAALDGDSRLTLPIDRMADLNGNAWVFERDVYGGLVRLVEWTRDGQTERLIECGIGGGLRAGLLTSLTLIDADGNAHPLVSYEHDRERNLVAAIDAMVHPHHFEYAAGHRMVSHTSARGVSFYYSYQQGDDGMWRVDHAWGDNGLFEYRFAYDRARMETRVTNSLGHTTIMQMNERGMPVAEIDPLGGVTSYQYDAQGRTNAKTDPARRTTRWEYDTYGNLLMQTLPGGSVLRVEYNGDHRQVWGTEPGGGQWRYTWDKRGNLLTQTAPSPANVHCYEYDHYGQLIGHTGPGGVVMRFGYDRDGHLAVLTDALGHRTEYTHDARGNLVKIVNALGQVSRYEYDRNSNLTRAIEPGGREAHCAYDADGNLVRYRDPAGNVTQLTYSALGQVSMRQTPDGNVVEFRRDTEEQLVGVVNERGELYELKRDGLGRIVEEVDYWGQPRRYEYGPLGELRRSIDPLGQAIVYQTDTLGRILQKQVPDPRQPDGTRTETFSYDRRGKLIIAANPDSRVELRYDDAGRLVEEQQGDDFAITYRYDAAGRRIERRTQLETGRETVTHIVRYGYDALGAVASIQIDDAAPVTIERDTLGRVRVEHLNEVLRRELTYTPDGQLARQALLAGTGVVFATEYAYDANGQMTEKRDSRLGTERFEYDPVGKLTGHLDPTGVLHRFLYDPAGDLLKTRIHQGSEGSRTALFDRELQTDTWFREGEYDGCHYTFDSIGNLLRKQDAQEDLLLRWDSDGLLIESLMVRSAVTPVIGNLRIHTRYEYDVFHRRTRKVTQIQRHLGARNGVAPGWTNGARTCCFFWEGDALVAEIARGNAGARSLLADAAVDADLKGAEVSAGMLPEPAGEYQDAREWVYYPGTFRPLAGIRCAHLKQALNVDGGDQQPTEPLASTPRCETQHVFFYTDPNGAATQLAEQSGMVSWIGRYGAWGNVSLGMKPRFDQPLRFQGQYFDEETGLHYNRNRYYDAWLGQFVSEDPLRLVGGGNLHQYAPNALAWIDPVGLAAAQDPIALFDPNNPLSYHAIWAYLHNHQVPGDVTVERHAKSFANNAGVLKFEGRYHVFSSYTTYEGKERIPIHAEDSMISFLENIAKQRNVSLKDLVKNVEGAYSILSPCAEKNKSCMQKTTNAGLTVDFSLFHLKEGQKLRAEISKQLRSMGMLQ